MKIDLEDFPTFVSGKDPVIICVEVGDVLPKSIVREVFCIECDVASDFYIGNVCVVFGFRRVACGEKHGADEKERDEKMSIRCFRCLHSANLLMVGEVWKRAEFGVGCMICVSRVFGDLKSDRPPSILSSIVIVTLV